MRPVIAQCFVLLATLLPITVSDILDYEIFDDTELEDGLIMGDSPDLFGSDDFSSEIIPMDQAEDDQSPMFAIGAVHDCSSEFGAIPSIGKARREALCQENVDSMNEQPFILPSFLLDGATIDTMKYCPPEMYDEGSMYLVCSSGFSMDMLDYGVQYQALVNSELGTYLIAMQHVLFIFSGRVWYLSSQN